MKILGIDPGLCHTGWGMIEKKGNQLIWIDHGVISAPTSLDLSKRLAFIYLKLEEIVKKHEPIEIAVEDIFVAKNPASAIKLGMGRSAAFLLAGLLNLNVFEYKPNQVKKAVVGSGHAEKTQVSHMIKILLNIREPIKLDSSDALAVAICHAHSCTPYSKAS